MSKTDKGGISYYMGIRVIEAFLTSSVLIVAVLMLRRLCRGKISFCLQYGIWMIVAVKLLLVPVPFLASPFSIMNLINIDTETAVTPENTGKVQGTAANTESTYVLDDSGPDRIYSGEGNISESTYNFGPAEKSQTFIPTEKDISDKPAAVKKFLEDFLRAFPFLLYVIAFLLAAWMFFYNIKFYRRLRSARIPYIEDESGKEEKAPKIYLVEDLKTPCLYGMSIYLPIDIPKDAKKLRHVLAHEAAHYRHKDFIWSFLRLLCTALNWYNPFVWIAAAAEKQDCELACDELAIKTLGEEERISYGETLIRLVGEKAPQDILTIGTTMTASAREIKARISFIAKKPVTVAYIIVIAGVFLTAAVWCTFTGKAEAAGVAAAQLVFLQAEGESTEPDENETETASEEGLTVEAASKEYTREELVKEFAQLTEDNTFSVYVRSVSRSAKEIDLFSMEVWNHTEAPSDYGSLALSEDCLYHFYSFDPESGMMEFQDVDFDRFVNGLSLDGTTDVECKVSCKGGLVTDIVAYIAYGGITYSEPAEERAYYDLHGTEGYQLAGTYMADVSEAEGMEKIYVYSGNTGDGDSGYVIVEKQENEDGQPGEILWVEEAHTARAGWNNVYLGEMDGKAFLFTLSIDVRSGFGTLAYHAFRLDAGGNPLPYSGAKFTYEAESYQAENFTQWYSSMSVYGDRSVLLLSTQDGILKTGPGTIYDIPSLGGDCLPEIDSSYNIVPGSSDTAIPAPEESRYVLMKLKDMIEIEKNML